MSTPSRPLASHTDSTINSRSSSPLKSRHTSPYKHTHQKKLPKLECKATPKKSDAEFHIYEDTQREYELYHKPKNSDNSVLHDDKENILQPKGAALAHSRLERRPLAPLNIAHFPGFCSSASQWQQAPIQLQEVYQPKHSNNEARTLHKHNGLPCFITPPRNTLNKILCSTRNTDEADELEQRLILRLNRISRRKRALSVGFNSGKAHLVQKNPFHIYTH